MTAIDPAHLEELAKEKLTQNGWYYASSNAGLSETHLTNRQAFFRHKIVPRQLVDTNERSTRTTIFGHEVSPSVSTKSSTLLASFPWPKSPGSSESPYSLSTAGSFPIEDVARAHDSGRLSTLRSSDADSSKIPQGAKVLPAPEEAGGVWIDSVWHGRAWSWEKAQWARERWREISGSEPFLIKGIQRVDDAQKAAELGLEGIVVSNHAGRQVDGAIASLDALENIVEAVGDEMFVAYDSGVRGAADIVKALALGAKFVFLGRLWIWGLSITGESGVRHVLKGLLADLDILMNVAGIKSVKDINRDLIESLPRSYNLVAERSKL